MASSLLIFLKTLRDRSVTFLVTTTRNVWKVDLVVKMMLCILVITILYRLILFQCKIGQLDFWRLSLYIFYIYIYPSHPSVMTRMKIIRRDKRKKCVRRYDPTKINEQVGHYLASTRFFFLSCAFFFKWTWSPSHYTALLESYLRRNSRLPWPRQYRRYGSATVEEKF